MSVAELLTLTIGPRRRRLGEILVEQQLLTEEELETALIYQKARPGSKLGTVLRDLGHVDSTDFMEALIQTMPTVKSYKDR